MNSEKNDSANLDLPIRGRVTADKCGSCGHHEIGITTEAGGFIPLKPGMTVEILGAEDDGHV